MVALPIQLGFFPVRCSFSQFNVFYFEYNKLRDTIATGHS